MIKIVYKQSNYDGNDIIIIKQFRNESELELWKRGMNEFSNYLCKRFDILKIDKNKVKNNE